MGGLFSRNFHSNLEWARRFLSRHAPDYRFRWDIYFSLLKEKLTSAHRWLDAGAGENKIVGQYQALGFKVGLDCRSPLANPKNFVRARLETLPFKNGSVDFVSARYVLEHLEKPELVWSEWRRVLKPGGRVLVQTPNLLSYLSFLPHLLPYRLKRFLIFRFFHLSPRDIFKTYHRFNRPGKFRKIPGFSVEKLVLSEDMHLHFRPFFYVSFLMHILTRFGALGNFRSTLTIVLKRENV